MIKLLGALITIFAIAGVGVILEAATGAIAYVCAHLRASASPHAKDGADESEQNEEHIE